MYINVVIGTRIYVYLFTKIYFLFVHIKRHNFKNVYIWF